MSAYAPVPATSSGEFGFASVNWRRFLIWYFCFSTLREPNKPFLATHWIWCHLQKLVVLITTYSDNRHLCILSKWLHKILSPRSLQHLLHPSHQPSWIEGTQRNQPQRKLSFFPPTEALICHSSPKRKRLWLPRRTCSPWLVSHISLQEEAFMDAWTRDFDLDSDHKNQSPENKRAGNDEPRRNPSGSGTRYHTPLLEKGEDTKWRISD